jgi:hypothetical protein
MMRTRLFLLSGLLAVLAAAPGCLIVTDDDDDGATLEVSNESDFVITDIYLTEVGNPDWGPNLLRGDVLLPDESLVLVDIRCDFYDAQLIDEDGVECELLDIDLCLNDALWIVRNNTCAVWTATGWVEAEKKPLPAGGHTTEKQKADPAPAVQI